MEKGMKTYQISQICEVFPAVILMKHSLFLPKNLQLKRYKKNFTSIKNLLSLVFLTLFLISCGHKQNPTGGKKDTVKPEIVNIFPEEFSDIKDQNMEVTFSKPIDRTTILTGLYIYPPILKKKFKWDKNVLIIKIYEELEINTNYFFTFSKKIKGEHKNELDQDYIFVFKNGKLNENRISGNFYYELEEDKNEPIKINLMTADSISIFVKEFQSPTYEFDNLNNIEHQIRAYIDKNKNERYDEEKEPFFQVYIPAQKFFNIDIELVYVDTLKPEIKSAKVLFEDQIELTFSEEIKNFSQISFFTDDSLQTGLNLKANYLEDDKLFILCEKMDTLNYILQILDLEDFKNNISEENSIKIEGKVVQDTIPPEIVYIKPRNGSIINNLNPEIEIFFSEIILQDNIEVKLISSETNNIIRLANIQSDSKKYLYKPKKKLENYSSYKIEVKAVDNSGKELPDFSSVFIPIFR